MSTVESLTGGQLAAIFTNEPGSSAQYVGGAVTYWTEFKQSLLGISDELVAEHGVVSAPCAEAMASAMRELSGSTYALATTGVAGPEPQEGKPVGTVFIALAGPSGVDSMELNLDGTRAEIQVQTCGRALEFLRARLTGQE